MKRFIYIFFILFFTNSYANDVSEFFSNLILSILFSSIIGAGRSASKNEFGSIIGVGIISLMLS